MKITKIISGFPGTGKTFYSQNTNLEVLDSDSSKFNWIEKGVRHPDFPQNYIEHIKYNIGKVDIIFISSHERVRDALVDNKIHFVLVFPERDLKAEYLRRFKDREDNLNFIDMIDYNWNYFIESMEHQTGCEVVRLMSGEFMADYLKGI